jgi:hypothetical protein
MVLDFDMVFFCFTGADFEEAFIQTVDKHAPVKQKKTMSKSSTILYK